MSSFFPWKSAAEPAYDDSEEPVAQPSGLEPWRVIHETTPRKPTVRVILERGQRGGYGWTISYENVYRETVLDEIATIDAALRRAYGEPS